MRTTNKIKTALIVALSLIVSGAIKSNAYIQHKVKRSETLYGIAYKYKVQANDIIKANPSAAEGLKTGMILNIPEPEDIDETPGQEATDNTTQQAEVAQQTAATIVDEPVDEKVDEPEEEAVEEAEEETIVEPATEPDESASIVAPYQEPDDMPTGVYIAKFGDTLRSISSKTGASVTELLRNNPLVDPEHIGEGTAIRLEANAPYINVGTPYATLVDSIVNRIQPTVAPSDGGTEQTTARTIAVLLPFDVENETISRQSLLATDFYKGFLMALKHNTGNGKMPIKIIAVDTQCDLTTLNHRLDQLAKEDVTVIIPPEDESQLQVVQEFALQNNILVLNALNIKDEGYLHYPNVVQCNINQKLMYEKAIDALLTDFGDRTPVILDIAGAKDEKSSFIEELRQRYSQVGRNVIDLAVNHTLTAEDLDKLPSSGKYILIPKSGTPDVLNRISQTMAEAIEQDPIGKKYKVFGYPDWTVIRGEQEEMLHRMGAIMYARFFMDNSRLSTREANDEFIQWYGVQMEDVYPSQGMLGYDVGNMLFSALQKKAPANDFNKIEEEQYRGEQSAFHFVRTTDTDSDVAGCINDALYIIEYLPGAGAYISTK